MQRLAKQAGFATPNDRQEKRFHRLKAFRQMGGKRAIVAIEAPVTSLPSLDPVSHQLLTKVFTNERVASTCPGL